MQCLGSHKVPKSSLLQKVSERVGDRFTLADLVIIYTRFGSSQPPVSLEITTTASLTRDTSTIIPKKVTEQGAYSLNTFQGSFFADFCCREDISCHILKLSWLLKFFIIFKLKFSFFFLFFLFFLLNSSFVNPITFFTFR